MNKEKQLVTEFLELVETWDTQKVEKFKNEVDDILERKWADDLSNL